MKKIKNIIFDLGGVLFPLSGQATLDNFANHGVPNIYSKYMELIESSLFEKFETGKCTPQEFRTGVNKLCNSKINNEDFDFCWNSMILSYPKQNDEILEKLKTNGFNLFILSNTNEIHVEFLEKMANWRDNLFNKIYYSNEIHLRKPDKECFEYVLNDSNLTANETIFLDDRLDNIESAQSIGINTFHVKNQSSIYEMLNQLCE